MTSCKTVLETINKYSLELFYLLKHHKIKKKELYEALEKRDKSLVLKLIVPINDKKQETLINNYNIYDCFDEILYITDNRYKHLKDIRNIVDINHIIKETINTKIYNQKLRVHYTDLILDSLIEEFYDYPSIKLFTKYKKILIECDQSLNIKITNNIDRYYIKKITI